MEPSRQPRRGELWWVDFGQPIGHEQGGRRPALILSVDGFRGCPLHLVSKERLAGLIGTVSPGTLSAVAERVRFLTGL